MAQYTRNGAGENVPLYDVPNGQMPHPSQPQPYHTNTAYSSGDYMVEAPLTDKHHHYTNVTYIPQEGNSNKRPQRLKRKGTGSSSLFKGEYKVSKLKIPKFAAPWQHREHHSDPQNPSTVRVFEPHTQWRRILITGIIPWFWTAFLCGVLAGIFKYFSSQDTITQGEKYLFNALNIGMSLLIGLALVKGLKSYVKLLSWRFLASGYRSLQDFQLVMDCDSQWTVFRLLWAGRTRGQWWPNSTQILCVICLLVFVGLQLAIALLGLVVSVEISSEWQSLVPGMTNVANMTQLNQDLAGGSSQYDSVFAFQAGAANVYGTMGQDFLVYTVPLSSDEAHLNGYYVSDTGLIYYKFLDWCATPNCQNYAGSNRTVNVTYSCEPLEIVDGGYAANISLIYNDESGNVNNITLPQTVPELSTTWMGDTNPTCGPRCSTMYVLNTGSDGSNVAAAQPSLYTCNSTLSLVQGLDLYPNNSAYQITDDVARQFAGAIAWNGQSYDGTSLQFRTYTTGSPWSWDGRGPDKSPFFSNSTGIGNLVAYYATGAIAAIDNGGPRLDVKGYAPVPASALSINWMWVAVILGSIPFVQFLVLIVVVIWANGAVIKDSDALSTARLLRPIVEKLDQHGCALTADEIAESLGNFKIVYGVRQVGDNGYHVGLIEEHEGFGEKAEEGWWPGSKFPAGPYDGIGYADEAGSSDSADDSNEKDMLLSKEEV